MDIGDLCRIPDYYKVFGFVAVLFIERWLEKTKLTRAGSIIGLIINAFVKKAPHQEFTMESKTSIAVPGMATAFDVKNLQMRLKANGVDLAEDLCKVLVGTTFDWVQDSLNIHPNAYLKFLSPAISTVKPLVLTEVDKIDGKVG